MGIGVVAIGRNEGERLRACLASALRCNGRVVYVDSNSSDGSVELARSLGVEVVELDMKVPFTAARARNEGFAGLMEIMPECELVQFVDGDCEIVSGWIERASAEMHAKPQAAVVCGRRRERHPDASIYNRLCDIEWDTPVGQAEACGGDALVRVSAFREVGGYDASVIAGEEPEMCVRLRAAGWSIERIDAEMTLHDAAMTSFCQWWKRAMRSGHAYAEGHAMHGRTPQRHWAKEVASNWIWGLLIPLLTLALAWPTRGISLVLLAGYAVLFAKVYRYGRSRGLIGRDARLWAASIVIGKFPHAIGQMKYWLNRLTGRRTRLIEYKSAAAGAPARGHAAT